MSLSYFGTDGIRGRYGECPITVNFAWRLGCALANFLASKKPGVPLNVVVGRDPRKGGELLFNTLASALSSSRIFVHDAGVVPTPAIAQAVVELSADMGLMITASHNPAQDNGFKLFDAKGTKLTLEEELEIEQLIDAESNPCAVIPKPKCYPIDALACYINAKCALMDEYSLHGMKIVVDTANGAMASAAPEVFKRMGATVFLIGDCPNGENINDAVGSEYPAAMVLKVRESKAQMGVAFDGDGDRLVVCDELGQLVDGDQLLGIFALDALREDRLKGRVLVSTIQSNLGLDSAVMAAGGRVERVAVGDRHVAQTMRKLGANLGGENSGHIVLSDFSTTGDGLLAACQLVNVMRKRQLALSELSSAITLFPQITRNLTIVEKKPFQNLFNLNAEVKAFEERYGSEGRILMRYSGTESKLRLLVEQNDINALKCVMDGLVRAAKCDLDVITH
jgi:phosphoglucosamine mutase